MVGSISSLGLGSQLQLQDILDQLRKADEQIITAKQDQITEFQAKVDEFTVINNKLLTMKSHALSLTLNSSFLGRTVSNSDPEVLEAAAVDGATAQRATITVDRLAATSSFQLSSGVESATSVFNAEAITISYTQGGTTVTLDVPAGMAYADLVTLINDDPNNPGVTASMIDSGEATNPHYLVLRANNTGESNRISDITGLTMTEVQGADPGSLNSQITVDGITYQRQTNSITDVLAGVTLDLQGTGSASVSVAQDHTALSTSITDLVEAYNDVVQEIGTQVGYDETSKAFGILADTGVRSLVFQLQEVMSTVVKADAAGNITSMYDIGIEFNRDGTITLDKDVLATAVADNLDGLQAFFLGDETKKIEGFTDRVNEKLRMLTSTLGLVQTEKKAAQSQIQDLELRIETETERLDRKYELMTRQFVALDQYMSQMSSVSSFLTSQFDSLDRLLGGGSK